MCKSIACWQVEWHACGPEDLHGCSPLASRWSCLSLTLPVAPARFGAPFSEMWRACMRRGWTLQSRLKDVHIGRLCVAVVAETDLVHGRLGVCCNG